MNKKKSVTFVEPDVIEELDDDNDEVFEMGDLKKDLEYYKQSQMSSFMRLNMLVNNISTL